MLSNTIVCTVAVFINIILQAKGFNLDEDTATLHHGQPGSYFGYSVAMHSQGGESGIYVGAPLALVEVKSVEERRGDVFVCSVSTTGTCTALNVDSQESDDTETKSGMWLGATVESAKENGFITVCAPRYIYHRKVGKNQARQRLVMGRCYIRAPNDIGFRKLDVYREDVNLQTKSDPRMGHGLGQLGISAALNKNGSRLVMGAVGPYFWEGQLYSYNITWPTESSKSKSHRGKNYGDAYLGYSLVAADFTGDGQTDYAAGRPRGSHISQYYGQVNVYTEDMELVVDLTGEQLGEYFGYSLAASDLNGDGHQDLIVGAPMFTSESSLGEKYDTGCAYIFYWFRRRIFHKEKSTQMFGREIRSRFGTAIVGLGDLNKDRYEDLAIGAPYERGTGLVYIYQGSADGIKEVPSQILEGSQFTPNLHSFGFTLDGGMDVDGNEYADLVVGAYGSDAVVLYRSRPIVKVTMEVSVTPDVINIDDLPCITDEGPGESCIIINACLVYEGNALPASLTFQLKWSLDDASSRVYFKADATTSSTRTYTYSKDLTRCNNVTAFIKADITDILSPITFSVSFNLTDEVSHMTSGLYPVIDEDTEMVIQKQVRFARNCGAEDICIPNLLLHSTSSHDFYTMGSTGPIRIDINLDNWGEDAYLAEINIDMPPGVRYNNVRDVVAVSPVQCYYLNPPTVTCRIGNKLGAGEGANFTVQVAADGVNPTMEVLDFQVTANSANKENHTEHDNHAAVRIPVEVDAEVTLTGVSTPEQVTFNTSSIWPYRQIEDIGPEILHTYQIMNLGPSTISETQVDIFWPARVSSNNPEYGAEIEALYLTAMPEVSPGGFGSCEVEKRLVDSLGLQPFIEKADSRRFKRMAADEVWEEEFIQVPSEFSNKANKEMSKINCDEASSKCHVMRCTIYTLTLDNAVSLRLNYRLSRVAMEQQSASSVMVSSRAEMRVTQMPYSVTPEVYPTADALTRTHVNRALSASSPVSIWVIVVSSCAGVLVLVLLVIVLWKCGFFRRVPVEEAHTEKSEKDARKSWRETDARAS